jgi:hypothetical protein
MSKQLFRTLFVAGAMVAAITSQGLALAAEPKPVEITAPALRAVYPSEAQSIVGRYRMSDGRSMTLRHHGRTIVADLDGEPRARLLAQPGASGWQLSSADGHMQMSIAPDADGQADTVTVSLVRTAGNQRTLALLTASGKR